MQERENLAITESPEEPFIMNRWLLNGDYEEGLEPDILRPRLKQLGDVALIATIFSAPFIFDRLAELFPG